MITLCIATDFIIVLFSQYCLFRLEFTATCIISLCFRIVIAAVEMTMYGIMERRFDFVTLHTFAPFSFQVCLALTDDEISSEDPIVVLGHHSSRVQQLSCDISTVLLQSNKL